MDTEQTLPESSPQAIEGTVIVVEGRIDWSSCQTPGLQEAFEQVEDIYKERMKAVELEVGAVHVDSIRSLDHVAHALFGSDSQKQAGLRAELMTQAAREGYSEKLVGNARVMCVPQKRILQWIETEDLFPTGDYNCDRIHIRVERNPVPASP